MHDPWPMTHDGTPIVKVNQVVWLGRLDKDWSDKTDTHTDTQRSWHYDDLGPPGSGRKNSCHVIVDAFCEVNINQLSWHVDKDGWFSWGWQNTIDYKHFSQYCRNQSFELRKVWTPIILSFFVVVVVVIVDIVVVVLIVVAAHIGFSCG